MSIFVKALLAALGVTAFGVVFHTEGKKLPFFALAGALSWVVFDLTSRFWKETLLCYFFATVVSSLYAEILARIQKTPVTIYLVAGLIPLVPGSGIYQTMEYFVLSEQELFWQNGLYTIGIAAMIGFAMIVVSTITRICIFVANRVPKVFHQNS